MAKKITKIPDKIMSKQRLFNEIPIECELFFTELGYKKTTWKAQKTRITNKLEMEVGNLLSPMAIRQILEHLITTTSKVKSKAMDWLDLFKDEILEDNENTSIDQQIQDQTDLVSIPEHLLKKYNVKIEDVVRKHFILLKGDYDLEIKKRLGEVKGYVGYRFSYDIQIVLLLKELRELDQWQLFFLMESFPIGGFSVRLHSVVSLDRIYEESRYINYGLYLI